MATYRIRFQATGGTVICTTNTNLGADVVDSTDPDYLQGWVTIKNTEATHQPQVTLVQDLTGLITVDDSFGLQINWGNVNTYALFMPTNTDVSSATWKYGSTQIKGSTLTGVADYGQIIVSANSVQTGEVGDNVTGVQVSTKAGLNNPPYNNPAYVNNGHIAVIDGKPAFNYGVSWSKPANSTDLMYYLVLEHKGDPWGQSDGYAVGGVGIVSKDRQGYTNRSGWFDGSTGKHIKITIHAMYKGGAIPSLVGLPQNVEDNRNQNTTEDYAAWLKFDTPPAGDPEYYTVKFYDSDKTTLLQTKDGRVFDTSYQKGARIGGNYPSATEICPAGKGLTGWVQKIDNGTWGSTVYTSAQVAQHTVNSNLSYAAVYHNLTYTITYNIINGTFAEEYFGPQVTTVVKQYASNQQMTWLPRDVTPAPGFSTSGAYWTPESPYMKYPTGNATYVYHIVTPIYKITFNIINGTWSEDYFSPQVTTVVKEYLPTQQMGWRPKNVTPNEGWALNGAYWTPKDPYMDYPTGDSTYTYNIVTPMRKVTYEIVNGYWEDGTNDPIIQSYPSGTQMPHSALPKNMTAASGWSLSGAYWSPESPYMKYVNEDITYTYNIITFLGSIYIYDNNRWYIGTPYINIAEGNNWRKGIGYVNDGTTWKKGGGG